MGILLTIDNGGTFTDVCASNGERISYAKAPTTPHDLTQCFVSCLARASRELYGEEDLGRLIGETDYLRYSTTSGTNAVVERKGQPVALIVEAGEEDKVYGAVQQFGTNNLWHSMVPRRPTGLRIGKDDAVDAGELLEAVARILQDGGQRLVIALRSAAAERAVKEILLERYPRHLLGAVPFLISHELDQDADDARRTLTAVLNSYLHPGMEHFLYGAENVCKQHRLAHPLLIYRNDGDSARVAKTTAIKTWGSGPRGGLEGTVAYARHYGIDTLVAMDIGGTTTDVSIVCDGRVKMDAHGKIEAATTSLSLPDMQSFGLGGSSVISVQDRKIVIGPESVGAAPGPACFGRGGKEMTLTDALLLAGVIDGEHYLGGELKLDPQRAKQAIEAKIAAELGVSVNEAVVAVIEAFQMKCAEHLTAVIRDAGKQPAEATLLAFGGGGAMIVTGIARAAGIRRVIVPHLAAVFSAYGIGFSNLAHEYRVPLHGRNPDKAALATAQATMLERARRDMYGEGVDPDACSFDFTLQWSVDGEVVSEALGDAALKRMSGVVDPSLHLKATYPLPSPALVADAAASAAAPAPAATAKVRTGGKTLEAVGVYPADSLKPGHAVEGPALIRDAYLTCLLQSGWSLRVTGNQDLMIEETSK
ncbi:MAG: hydantoinase/oxoprolinase family protein [Sinimarinibacterium flocculans]|uniref:hydantoinase/oxoprolinase family protein n=1 Tax=Sinimarinibacterium flocculans TaxID=985250 RepID=UPI003C5359B8